MRRYSSATVATLALVSVVAYAPALRGGFVYDDIPQVLENPFVFNPRLWWRAFTGSVWAFQGAAFPANFYRPLHIFTHALLYRLGGPNPGVFHLLSVLLYAATVILVYEVGRRLVRSELVALVGALLWCAHPLHVEAVAWISALPELGSGFFYLLAFLLFLHAEETSRNRQARHVLAAVLFFPALLFKEMAVSFPLLLIGYWFFFPVSPGGGKECTSEADPPSANWRDKVACWLPYGAALAVYLVVRRLALGYVSNTPRPWNFSARVLEAAVGLLGEHLRIFLWPMHLSAFRTFDLGSSLRSAWPWLSLGMLMVAFWARKQQPQLGFLIAWWGITLIPCLDVRQLSIPLVADRYSYLPSVGLCLASSILLVRWIPQCLPVRRHPSVVSDIIPDKHDSFRSPHPALPRLRDRHPLPRGGEGIVKGYEGRHARVLLAASVLLVTLALWTGQSVRSIAPWHDNESLANHGLKQSPKSASLHLVLAWRRFYQNHDPEDARREYETALQLNAAAFRPMSALTYEALIGLGQVAERSDHLEEAVSYFEQATRIAPYRSPAYDALGAVYFPRRDYAQAAECYTEAVQVNSQDLVARFCLGTCLMKLRRYREAAEQFRAAAAVDPTYEQAAEAQAHALKTAREVDEAARLRQGRRSR